MQGPREPEDRTGQGLAIVRLQWAALEKLCFYMGTLLYQEQTVATGKVRNSKTRSLLQWFRWDRMAVTGIAGIQTVGGTLTVF